MSIVYFYNFDKYNKRLIMSKIKISIKINITVLFENPFWICLYERIGDNKHETCKIIFITEPSDKEIHNYLLKNLDKLKFHTSIIEKPAEKPKRQRKKKETIISSEKKTSLKKSVKSSKPKTGKKTTIVKTKKSQKERPLVIKQEKKKKKKKKIKA